MSENWIAEPRPEERLRLLESVLENANDAVIVTDADPIDEPGPRTVYVNQAFTSMTGYTSGEIVGESPRILQGPETDREKLREIRAALMRSEPIRVELLNYHKDGTEFWVELDIVPVGGEGGWPDYWLSVQRETTERVQAEQRRRESERRLRSILAQYGSDMITTLAPDGTPTYESPQVERTLGYRHGELADGNLYRYVHPDAAGRLADAAEQALRTPGVNPPVEYRIRHDDGSWLYFESIANNLAQDPDVGAIVVNTRDITERKRNERALRESEEKFRSTFENAPVGVALVGPDNRFLAANRALCDMFGYSEEELLGSTSYEITHPEDREISRSYMQEVLEEEHRQHLEKCCLHADGSVVWVLLSVSVVRGSRNELDYYVCQYQDITARKRAEEALARERGLLDTVINSAHDLIFVKDLEHRFALNNRAHAEALGARDREELLGKTNIEYWGEERTAPHHADDRRVMDTGEPVLGREEPILFASGEERWLSTTKVPLRAPQGEIEGLVAICRDITEKRQTEQALRENEELLRAVTSGAPVILFALDLEGTITLSEGKGLAAVGEEPGEAVGRSIFEDYGHSPDAVENVRRALDGEEVVATVEIDELSFEARYSPIRDPGGAVTGVIGVATDVTERRKLEKELEHRAFHDPLTDLPNRSLFMDRLSHALERTERTRQNSLAVLFMDLDGFKAVNDRFGHDEGDRVLVEAAQRLRRCLRPVDTVSRMGGDEFAVLLEDAGYEGSSEVAERILGELRAPFVLSAASSITLTLSIGIACGTSSEPDPAELLRVADRAMYRAKAGGRDTYRLG